MNNKNILLISYMFPPLGGPRSIRWAYFTNYLSKRGYQIDVLTILPLRKHPTYNKDNETLIPSGVSVHRIYPGITHKFIFDSSVRKKKINEGEIEKKRFNNILGLIKELYESFGQRIFIPEGAVECLPWGIETGYKLIKENNYGLIISSCPPFTDHIIAFFLKKKVNIPWVADYGDPWVFNPVLNLPGWRKIIDKFLEESMLKAVDRMIVTTEATKESYLKFYPFLKHEKISVIPQGCNVEKFKAVSPKALNNFRIVYTGRFYDKVRKPYAFFEAIKRFNKEDMKVIIAGDILPKYSQYVFENGLSKKVIFLGHKPHLESIALQKGATILLFLGNNSPYQLPGKIFEYLAAKRPILGVRYNENDLGAKYILKHNRGIVVENNPSDIVSGISQLYRLWEKGELDKSFNLDELREYSWENSAKKMEEVILSCL